MCFSVHRSFTPVGNSNDHSSTSGISMLTFLSLRRFLNLLEVSSKKRLNSEVYSDVGTSYETYGGHSWTRSPWWIRRGPENRVLLRLYYSHTPKFRNLYTIKQYVVIFYVRQISDGTFYVIGYTVYFVPPLRKWTNLSKILFMNKPPLFSSLWNNLLGVPTGVPMTCWFFYYHKKIILFLHTNTHKVSSSSKTHEEGDRVRGNFKRRVRTKRD